MKKRIFFAILIVTICINCSGCYLFTPFARIPKPAGFNHLWTEETEGQLFPLKLDPKNIYGMGLTYTSHLKETGSEFNPDKPPPVFRKSLLSLNQSGKPVNMPTKEDLINCAEGIETGLGEKVDKKFEKLSPLLIEHFEQ